MDRLAVRLRRLLAGLHWLVVVSRLGWRLNVVAFTISLFTFLRRFWSFGTWHLIIVDTRDQAIGRIGKIGELVSKVGLGKRECLAAR